MSAGEEIGGRGKLWRSYVVRGLLVGLLGLFALFWYNVVYTLLKKITPFAVLPGALCGALPLIMGWALAGGSILDSPILMLSAKTDPQDSRSAFAAIRLGALDVMEKPSGVITEILILR